MDHSPELAAAALERGVSFLGELVQGHHDQDLGHGDVDAGEESERSRAVGDVRAVGWQGPDIQLVTGQDDQSVAQRGRESRGVLALVLSGAVDFALL